MTKDLPSARLPALLLLVLFIYPASSFAQGTSRALIIGVSHYSQLPKESQLEFADHDAQAFYDFIRSTSAGHFEDDHVKLLLNAKATAAEIYAGLNWLVDETKEDDRVVIYFSGHGDIERKTVRQRGFLLAYDSPPAGYNVGGTIDVTFLQDYLETLAAKKARVILITDACRSGKLAGGQAGAAQTTAALQEQWTDITKVLSSQAGELSEESMKWGDGHGIFTFSLINGLWGLADRNGDGMVSLGELNIYLSMEVPTETGETQHPVVSGDQRSFLSKVDSAKVAALRVKNLMPGASGLLLASNKGDFGKLDSAAAQIREHFITAISSKRLIAPASGSAYHYFKQFSSFGQQYPAVMNEMRRILVARLEDDAQTILNRYMKQELAVSSGAQTSMVDETRFALAGHELDSALSLMSKENGRYNSVLSRSLFLRVNVLGCTCAPNDISHSKARSSLATLKKAIVLEPEAAYLYNSLGSSYFYLNMYDSAIIQYSKAIELAPTWTYPITNLGTAYDKTGELDKSISTHKKSIEIGPNDIHSYLMIYRAWVDKYKDQGKDTFTVYLKEVIKTHPTEAAYKWLGDLSQLTKKFEQAAYYWNLAIDASVSQGKLADANEEANLLFSEKEYDAGLLVYNKILNVLDQEPKLLWPYFTKSKLKRVKGNDFYYDDAELSFDNWEYDPDSSYYISRDFKPDSFWSLSDKKSYSISGWRKTYLGPHLHFEVDDDKDNQLFHASSGWQKGFVYSDSDSTGTFTPFVQLGRFGIDYSSIFRNLAKIYELKKNVAMASFYNGCYYWWRKDDLKAVEWLDKAFSNGYKPTGREPEVELLGMEVNAFNDLLMKHDIELKK